MRRFAALTSVALVAAGCSTAHPQRPSGTAVVQVVAAENFWGSLVSQVGGAHVQVRSIIDNPNADPHDYEPTAADARLVAAARLVVVNGIGYDAWATKLVGANPAGGRVVVTVGDVVGVRPGGNPHRWYSPTDVRLVIGAVTTALEGLDPADAAYFDTQRQAVLATNLGPYFAVIADIKARYAGTPVGASESIFALMSPDLGLRLLTPEAFLRAVSEGGEPSARDKATIDAQIKNRAITVYVYNSQNATPDVQAQVAAARRAGIPVTTVTETLTPAGASFQDWQVAQLRALERALARATGR